VGIVVFIFLGDWRSALIPCLAGTGIAHRQFGGDAGLQHHAQHDFALRPRHGNRYRGGTMPSWVIEAVNVKMSNEHLPPLEATQAAMKEISGAIIAITLVMAAVFIPVAFMGGPEGMFYRQFSITMASSIILSGFVALTLTPALCALILTKEQEMNPKKSWLHRALDKFNSGFNKSIGKYRTTLERTVSRRGLTLLLLLALCAVAFFINNSLPSGFIPEEDQGMIYAVIETPPGSTIERTNKVAHKLLAIAQNEDGVESVSSLAGYEILSEGTSCQLRFLPHQPEVMEGP
jgi:HAE1 family hydrophobic/amphiphilic exporter-1